MDDAEAEVAGDAVAPEGRVGADEIDAACGDEVFDYLAEVDCDFGLDAEADVEADAPDASVGEGCGGVGEGVGGVGVLDTEYPVAVGSFRLFVDD